VNDYEHVNLNEKLNLDVKRYLNDKLDLIQTSVTLLTTNFEYITVAETYFINQCS